jgi:multiple sugar transport system permease protein
MKISIGRVVSYFAAIVFTILFAFPLVFMVMSSLKPDFNLLQDVGTARSFLPVGPISFDNYVGVYDRIPLLRFIFNSLLVSTITVVLGLFVNSMLGFALARMEFRGKNLVFAVIISTLILPFEVLAIPLLYLMVKAPWVSFDGGFHIIQGIFNNYQVQILPFIANAVSVFLFMQYFKSLPKELDEAALVDGASWFMIYRKIAMPLAGPAIGTVSVLTFLPMWNSYIWPVMTVQDEQFRPIMIGLQYFYVNFGTAWGQIMAYLTILTIPVVILFLSMQRFFTNSIATTGIKG